MYALVAIYKFAQFTLPERRVLADEELKCNHHVIQIASYMGLTDESIMYVITQWLIECKSCVGNT
jgi:hypothetical protein